MHAVAGAAACLGARGRRLIDFQCQRRPESDAHDGAAASSVCRVREPSMSFGRLPDDRQPEP
jgi:hypothetical protein